MSCAACPGRKGKLRIGLLNEQRGGGDSTRWRYSFCSVGVDSRKFVAAKQ